MEEPLQHQTTTQCIGLPPTCARGHLAHGPKPNHALTFKLDHSSGAAQDHFKGGRLTESPALARMMHTTSRPFSHSSIAELRDNHQIPRIQN
jgi:hypothetical protein